MCRCPWEGCRRPGRCGTRGDCRLFCQAGGGIRDLTVTGVQTCALPIFTADDLLDMVEHQAQQGVDYVTVHCGILREYVGLALGRVTGIVSRGGSLHAYWMMHHNQQ